MSTPPAGSPKHPHAYTESDGALFVFEDNGDRPARPRRPRPPLPPYPYLPPPRMAPAAAAPPAPPVGEGHPMLAALAARLPLLRAELPGWSVGQLTQALDAFPDDPTDAQLADSLVKLREVLQLRARDNRWLTEIAKLAWEDEGQVVRRMDSPGSLPPVQPLKHALRNRTVVDQARRLVTALAPNPPKPPETAPTQPKPDNQ